MPELPLDDARAQSRASAPGVAERELIERLRAGDEDAFRALIEQHHTSLLRVAMMYLGDRTLAEEAVQDTWIGLLDSLGRFEGRASLKTWLFRILMNVCRSRRRKEARSIPFSSLYADEGAGPSVDGGRFAPRLIPFVGGHWTSPPARWSEGPEARALSAETRRCLADAIGTLPDAQREVITLRDVEGLRADEVCELLTITDANQRVLLHRARSKVRRALELHFREAG
jgi:RNA polymerase sigma-70 factor (ECF subfamily)